MNKIIEHFTTAILGAIVGGLVVLSYVQIISVVEENGMISMHYQKHLYLCEKGGRHE